MFVTEEEIKGWKTRIEVLQGMLYEVASSDIEIEYPKYAVVQIDAELWRNLKAFKTYKKVAFEEKSTEKEDNEPFGCSDQTIFDKDYLDEPYHDFMSGDF